VFGLKNKTRTVIDIIPVADRDNFDIYGREEIDLRSNPENKKPLSDEEIEQNSLDSLMSKIMDGDLSEDAKQEVEVIMSESEEALVELASLGVEVVRPSSMAKPRYRPVFNKYEIRNTKSENEFKKILAKIHEPVSPKIAFGISSHKTKINPVTITEVKPQLLRLNLSQDNLSQDQNLNQARVVAEEVISFYNNKPSIGGKAIPVENKGEVLNKKNIEKLFFRGKALNFSSPSKKKRTSLWLFFLILFGAMVYGLTLKNEIVREGIAALDNLENAGESLKRFNFSGAAENFEKSYQNFSQASQNLNLIGAGLAGFFEDLPGLDRLAGGGLGQIGSAKDIVAAGKLIAQSGQAMSQALAFLSQTGSILNPADKNQTKPLRIINQLKDALVFSSANFQKAKALIVNIDESIIPDDKKGSFADFKNKLPLLEKYLENAVEYADFLEGIVGIDEPRKYLFLFQNYSELRPTGGFPGTYGVVSFSGGGLADFFVEDVYNLDGQLKRNIIPPRQLQHITPTWGMRDSTWFTDFPTSAKKALSFFLEEAGYKADGVIALNPDIVSGILEIVGPIKMSEYGLTLTADNFLENIQEEVEYGPNRAQPKKVVSDFAPRFLEKLYSADADKWMKIFNVLMAGFNEKDILFYFSDGNLEDFVIREGLGGEVKMAKGDYLNVNFSNIKGSKTDAVTDSSINIETSFKDGQAIHRVVIARNHKGGDHEHGFYNRQNLAYVRVLLPEEAELLNISGNDLPNFIPLINYSIQSGFEKDRDLAIFESGFYGDKFTGVDKFEESGKKGIGFWMITDPSTTKQIEFEYKMPLLNKGILSGLLGLSGRNDYSFYFQKQPGLDWKNFNLKLNKSDDYVITSVIPELNKVGDIYIFDELLKKDFELKLKLKEK